VFVVSHIMATAMVRAPAAMRIRMFISYSLAFFFK
jgi:hypothetical protein